MNIKSRIKNIESKLKENANTYFLQIDNTIYYQEKAYKKDIFYKYYPQFKDSETIYIT